jgi:alkanesulfonate monooxygenase SsuD/methylene tetrahydromethanopterin reductase-like flavin-dependent oxidoreductase (luciferase family)
VLYAVSTPNFGVGLDARRVGDLAACAEEAGWDGFFLWDHVFAFSPGRVDLVDPWIALTVAATRTTRLRLGTAVTPVPRRRPLTLARQVATLDRLAGGRVTLGVGIGAMPFEWDYAGEETDLAVRGDMLDEGLDLMAALWTGGPVRHEGAHYRVAGVAGDGGDGGWAGVAHPGPVQEPRVPVWVAGTWPQGGRPFRRAAAWDGVVPMRIDGAWEPHDTAGVVALIGRYRDLAGFDVAVPGETGPGAAGVEAAAAHQAAGATWWVEAVHPWRYGLTDGGRWPLEEMAERISAGPPRAPAG